MKAKMIVLILFLLIFASGACGCDFSDKSLYGATHLAGGFREPIKGHAISHFAYDVSFLPIIVN